MKLSRNKISYLLISLLAHVLFVFYACQFGLVYILISLFVSVVIFNFTYTLYAHRILTHNNFKISPFFHKVFCTLYSAMNFGSVGIYAGVHIKHHQYSDTNDDPHDWHRLGLFRTLLKVWDSKYNPNRKMFVRVMQNPAVKKQHKNHIAMSLVSLIIFPALIVVSTWMSNMLIIAVHTPWLGYKNNKDSDSVNIPLLKPLFWGEELHANHHAKANKANHNFSKNLAEFDLIYYLGRFFSITPTGHV